MKKFFAAIAVLFTLACAAIAFSIALSSCQKEANAFNPPGNHYAERQAPKVKNSLSVNNGGCDYTIGSSGIPSLEFTVQKTK
jgi:hypothetical protein